MRNGLRAASPSGKTVSQCPISSTGLPTVLPAFTVTEIAASTPSTKCGLTCSPWLRKKASRRRNTRATPGLSKLPESMLTMSASSESMFSRWPLIHSDAPTARSALTMACCGIRCLRIFQYLVLLFNTSDSQSGKTMIENALYVGSVGKAFRVLDCFKGAAGDLSLTEIMERSGLDKSAAQRYAYTLSAEGYLQQNSQTRRYRLGPGVLDLTFHFLRTHALAEALNPCCCSCPGHGAEDQPVAARRRLAGHVLRHQTSTEHYHASLVGRRVPCNARRAGAP